MANSINEVLLSRRKAFFGTEIEFTKCDAKKLQLKMDNFYKNLSFNIDRILINFNKFNCLSSQIGLIFVNLPNFPN